MCRSDDDEMCLNAMNMVNWALHFFEVIADTLEQNFDISEFNDDFPRINWSVC